MWVHACMCACVRVCVRLCVNLFMSCAYACVCVCLCVHVCLCVCHALMCVCVCVCVCKFMCLCLYASMGGGGGGACRCGLFWSLCLQNHLSRVPPKTGQPAHPFTVASPPTTPPHPHPPPSLPNQFTTNHFTWNFSIVTEYAEVCVGGNQAPLEDLLPDDRWMRVGRCCNVGLYQPGVVRTWNIPHWLLLCTQVPSSSRTWLAVTLWHRHLHWLDRLLHSGAIIINDSTACYSLVPPS